MGWTASSNMAAIYVHLAGADLDAALTKVPTLQSVAATHCAARLPALRV